MDDTSKYLIHASLTADGVVERSDVVGAIFGQTEGLLGEELDLRDLQQSSKVGRIDVEVSSENGESTGRITIASSLDRVETAILAASLETISRVGPCRAHIEVTDVEDVREAKRRKVVDRAKELLTEAFDDSVITSEEILEEVRESVRVEDITEYEGFPAGPHVADSDAIVVVEGRADVLTLLRYGVKNAVAVEGTNVPEAVAELTQERTVTAFLDGDRGGELVLRELAQVGDVDYVAFAPEGRSVEDLARDEVMSALREKVTYESLGAAEDRRTAATAAEAVPPPEAERPRAESSARTDPPTAPTPDGEAPTDLTNGVATDAAAADAPTPSDGEAESNETEAETTGEDAAESAPSSLRAHVRQVVDDESGLARLLDGEMDVLADVEVDAAFDAVADAEDAPFALVLDGELSQRVLDVAAQRGLDHVVARSTGEFVKRPVDVRVRTADQLVADAEAG